MTTFQPDDPRHQEKLAFIWSQYLKNRRARHPENTDRWLQRYPGYANELLELVAQHYRDTHDTKASTYDGDHDSDGS